MLGPSEPMQLWIPSSSPKRVLIAGRVTASDAATFTAEFDQELAVAVDAAVNAYGELNGKFFQQAANVIEIREGGDRPLVVFARSGQPVSAEQRQTYRVSLVTAGLAARIGRQEGCSLVDMSADGFAAILGSDCKIGSIVQAVFEYENQRISIAVRTQTLKKLPSGKLRYGFLAAEPRGPAKKIFQQITSAAQRAQLRRRAGAA